MPVITQAAIHQWLVPSLLMFLFIGGLFSLAVGGGLILFSEKTLRLFHVMNRWVTWRRVSKPLAIPRDSWPILERYRSWFAAFFIVGAVFSTYNLIARIDLLTVIQNVSVRTHTPHIFASWIITSLWWLMIIGGILAIVVGVMLGFFPKTMAILETRSNRWYSVRNVTKGVDELRMPLEQWTAAYPRTAGGIIVLAALVEVVDIGVLLFSLPMTR